MDYENFNYKTENTKDVCRTCLKSTKNFISVFSNSEKYKKSYAKIIMEIAPVVITPDQKYSTNLCAECVNLICIVHDFQQQCIQVDSFIRFGSFDIESSVQFIKHEKNDLETTDTNLSSNFDFLDNLSDEKTGLEIIKGNKIFTETLKIYSDNGTNENTTNREENTKKMSIRQTESLKLTDRGQFVDVATKRHTENSSQFIKHEKDELEISDIKVALNFNFPDNLPDEKTDILESNEILTDPLHLALSNGGNEKRTNWEENNKKMLVTKTKSVIFTDSGESINVATKRRLVKNAIKEHSKEKTNHCDTCNKTFKARESFLSHIKNKHLGIKHSCDICGKIFTTKSNLLRHKKIHKGLTYMCEFCGKKFTRKHPLTQHIFTHTSKEKRKKTHKCDQCNKLFISQYRLQVHIHNCHSSKHNQVCELCNRIFSSSSVLNQHKASAHIVVKSSCGCGKQFKNPLALKLHKKNIHTNQRPYECKVCGDRFAYISGLKSHTLVHKGEKPFKCKFCPKTFRQSPHVKTHERIHTGEKPYSCEQCSKSFRHQTTFEHHMRIHTGEKPYRCKICDRSFSHLTNMKIHFLGHKTK